VLYYLQERNEIELLTYFIEGIIIMIKPTVDIHALVLNIGDLSHPPLHPPVPRTHIKDAHAGTKLGLDEPRGPLDQLQVPYRWITFMDLIPEIY
jgi:hypothetical protein